MPIGKTTLGILGWLSIIWGFVYPGIGWLYMQLRAPDLVILSDGRIGRFDWRFTAICMAFGVIALIVDYIYRLRNPE